jgi:hypothetical protein
MAAKAMAARSESDGVAAVPPLVDDGLALPAIAPAGAAPRADAVVLRLADLLPDAQGELVVLGGEGVPLEVIADHAIADAGVAPVHVTAAGLDVTGLAYCTFDNGITLYYSGDVTLSAVA